MHYDVQGEGEPLVLIHAAIANLNEWDAQMPAFARHFRVVRFDVRGFGETPDPAGKYTDHADLKALLYALGISHAHVLGNSNGGRIAMDFALTYPKIVAKLVMVAPGLPGYTPPNDKFAEEKLAKYEAALKAGDTDLAAEIIAQIWVDGPRRRPEQVDSVFPPTRACSHPSHNWAGYWRRKGRFCQTPRSRTPGANQSTNNAYHR